MSDRHSCIIFSRSNRKSFFENGSEHRFGRTTRSPSLINYIQRLQRIIFASIWATCSAQPATLWWTIAFFSFARILTFMRSYFHSHRFNKVLLWAKLFNKKIVQLRNPHLLSLVVSNNPSRLHRVDFASVENECCHSHESRVRDVLSKICG